jgi:serine/threonine protein kinase
LDPSEVQIFLSETLSGRYRPRSFIGAGNFSGAFRTDDLTTRAEVAAKILKLQHAANVDATREFRGEVALLEKLSGCDCVVQLLDDGQHSVHLAHGTSGGSMPFTTEFVILELAVCSLVQLLLQGPSFGWVDRLRLYRDVVKGVHQMHLRGIVHRDVKAENGLVFERPERAKVADLGRAHDTHEPPRFVVEAYLAGRGDTRFAPLEFLWLQGTQDPREQAMADLYLLGSLLFEMATGIGFTSVVIGNPQNLLVHNAAQPEGARLRHWQSQLASLREAEAHVLAALSGEVPAAIRNRTRALIAMLTDPDPERRLPTFSGGRRRVDPWDLQWLLDRVDALLRCVDEHALRAYFAGHTRLRHGAQRR